MSMMDIRTFFRNTTMDLFAGPGIGRHSNDGNNKRREEIIVELYHTEKSELQGLRTSWKTFLLTLCDKPYDDVNVRKHGGRSANYDFTLMYMLDGICIQQVKAEFKHNANKIDKLPEYFSPAADKPYITTLYADFFYDFLERICDVYPGLSLHKPSKEVYIRSVYTNNYDTHPFFRTLYDMEKTGTCDQAKEKGDIVRESIQTYLDQYAKTIDIEKLAEDIRQRQIGKVFIMWNLREFVSDSIHPDEMELTHVQGVKNNNTIVVMSKAGTRHNLLLRWKNHLGILYPAWQISLSR